MFEIIFLLLGVFSGMLASVILTGENATERLSRSSIDETEYCQRDKEKLYWFVDNALRSVFSLKILFMLLFSLSIILLSFGFIAFFHRFVISLVISIIFCGMFALFFMGIIPVWVGRAHPVKVSYHLRNILYFVSSFNNGIERIVLRKKKNTSEAEMKANVVRDLRELVDSVDEIDTFEAEDREIIESVFELGDTIVREIMVPRIDMVTVCPDESIDSTLKLFVKSGYSRLPVIGKDMDDVKGVVFLKDILRRLHYYPDDKALPIKTVIRPARFVPETMFSDNLMRSMQQELFHIAIVIDEYGGTAGLVTIEDLLEVLVGDLVDEHDKDVADPEEISSGIWKLPARFPINELDEILGVEIEDEDVDTVGGLLAKAIGKVPLPGATGSIHGINLIAQEAVGRRKQVGTILVSKQ